MRFDLIHSGYAAQYPDATLPELIKLKDSRKMDPKRQKPFGYSSFNARSEEITSKWTFKSAWKNADRCIIPITRIYENANMDEAPPEFKNKSYKLNLEHTAYLGCIYARIERKDQELYSFSIVTMSSEGHRIRKEIWHERMPVLLNQSEAEIWMDPKFPADAAWNMIKQYPGNEFQIEPWIKTKKAA
jgi:putative SOS response-associated peptidase YedK